MNTTEVKVVIDTNVLIAIISKKSPFRWIFNGIISGELRICVSTDIMFEYNEIIERKTNRAVAENIISALTVNPFAENVDIFYRFNLIENDSSDNKFADCAISSGANVLISNDRHFQILKEISFPKVNILTLYEFASQYQSIIH